MHIDNNLLIVRILNFSFFATNVTSCNSFELEYMMLVVFFVQ